MLELPVSVREPLEFPLTDEQIKYINDPWNIEAQDIETVFYILYDELKRAKGQFLAGLSAANSGVPTQLVAGMVADAMQRLKAGRWLGEKQLGLPRPKDGVFWTKEELDEVKINRGTSIFAEVITKPDGVGNQAWSLYVSKKIIDVRLDPEFCADVEIQAQDRNDPCPELRSIRLEHCSTSLELLKYDGECVDKIVSDLLRPNWEQGKVVPAADVDAWFAKYNEPNKDKIEKWKQLANTREQEAAKRFHEYAERRDKLEQEKKLSAETLAEDKKDKKGITSNMATKKNESTDLTTTAGDAGKKKTVEFKNVSVMYVDDPTSPKISLPKGMSYSQAREWLTKIETEENRKFAFMYKFKGWYPFDAMWAVYRALAELYGFVHVQDFKTMFGPVPPISITIETDFNTKTQIPWGPIEVHGLSAPLEPHIDFDRGLPCLMLTAEIKNHERTKVDELMQLAENVLKTASIYRGKAIEIDFTIFKPHDIQFDVTRAPKFMDTNVLETDIILPQDVRDLVETGIWTPIKHTQVCREQQIPLRRGVLLSGKYGVGKTLAARVTAMLCEKNGWTFLYLKALEQLPQALYFAKQYEPCVVFAEDINRVVSGERTEDMDKLFNVVDGIDRKNDEVMIIFTTNDVDEIHPGMLRPGRIDAVITVAPPDAEAASELVRFYGRKIVDEKADLKGVGRLLAGQIPAIIREAVERSKLAAIKDTPPGGKLVVNDRHLEIAAKQMLEHAKLLESPLPPKPDMQILGEALGSAIADGMRYRGNYATPDGDNDDSSSVTQNNGLVRDAVKDSLDKAGRPNQNGKSEPQA